MKKPNRILSAFLTLTIIFSMMLSSGQIVSYAGSFTPIDGVGNPDIEIPLSGIEGTVIYSNGEFSSETYVASSAKQLDSMIYQDRGTSSVGTDGENGSVFSFGTQGWLKVNNALNAYVQENGDVPGTIHEVTFDIKLSSGIAFLYPCFPTDNRDNGASLVLNGSTLTNDSDGTNYGTLPQDTWYRVKFTLDTDTKTVYTSVNGAVVYKGVFGGNSFNSVLYQTTADSTISLDNIKYVVKDESSDEPTTPPGEPGDDTNDFAPIPGVGSTDIEIPLSDIEGTVIYSNGEFPSETYVASSAKQLDSMVFQDKGASSVGTDETSGSVFSFGTQGYLTTQNALDAYVRENGNVSGAIQELTLDIKVTSGLVYLYPCTEGPNRDWAPSLVFRGTTLTNDSDGANYGTLPNDVWYRVKFTFDTETGTAYTSVNGAVVFKGVSDVLTNSLYSVLYQTTADSVVCIDNIKYVVKDESSEGPSTPPDEPGDDTQEFSPIPGVGSTDIEIPLSDVEGTIIYKNGDFSSGTYVSSSAKQLDSMIYQDKGTSSVGTDETSGSVFSFGTQGFMTTENALDAYVRENGNVSGTIQELTFDIKVSSGLVFLYPCTEGNNRDWAPSLVFRGTTLTNDSDGANYGQLPNDVWYRVKYTFDTATGTVYTSVNGAVVYKGVSEVLTNSLYSVLYQTTADSIVSIDNIKYAIKGENSDDPSTPPTTPEEPEDDTQEFLPVAGVGSTDIKVPLSDVEGTIIYKNGQFSSETFVTSEGKQLDAMFYQELGTSSVGTDRTNGSTFSFGKQGYLTPKNALDTYALDNGNVPGAIHEVTFDIKFSSGLVFIYPCGGGNARDNAASLVFRGTTLASDAGAEYGTLPLNKWYRIKFTVDTSKAIAYTSVNGAVVHKGETVNLASSLYSVLFQKTDDTTFSIDNVKYVIKGSTEIESVSVSGNTVVALTNDKLITTKDGKNIDFSKLVSLYCGNDIVDVDSVSYDETKKEFTIKTKKPLISAFEYTIKLSDTIVSESGIYVRENYEYNFKTPSKAFDIDEVWKEESTIKATVVNTTGSGKTVVMVVVGKNENGAITSMISTPKTVVGEDGLELQLTPDDENAITFEAFFIENWETGIPVKGGVYKGF